MKGLKRFAATLLCFVLVMGLFASTSSIKAKAYSTSHPNTWVNTGNQVEDLIGVAMTQVGYHGVEYVTGTKYGAWYGNTMAPWCGMFLSWCANQAGIPKSIILHSARANDFRKAGTYHDKLTGYLPKRGDIVLYNPSGSGGYYFPAKNPDGTYSKNQHVALVCSFDPATRQIWIVHGNATGDRVCYNAISIDNMAIQSFVTPNYTSGGSSGDGTPQGSYINGTSVRLRSEPSTGSSIVVNSLNYGEQVEVISKVTDNDGDVWYQVKVLGRNVTGYVFGEYVYVSTPPTSTPPTTTSDTINGNNVRLRSAPSTSSEILTEVHSGQVITLLETATDTAGDKWYKVSLTKDGTSYTGYVFAEFVNRVSPEPSAPTQTPAPVVDDVISSNNVRLRTAPNSNDNSNIITELNQGQVVKILTSALDSDGDKWYHVTANIGDSEKSGYVFASYVNLASTGAAVNFISNIENYTDNQTYDPAVTATLNICGWAFGAGVDTTRYIKIDSGKLIPLSAVSRPDVKAAYSTQCLSDNTGFNYSVDLTKLSQGTHTATIYVAGGTSAQSIKTLTFKIGDLSAPVGSDIVVTDVSEYGFTVYVNVTDTSGVSNVEFPTWTSTGGKDDLIHYTTTIHNDNVYCCYVPTSSFTKADDTYIMEIYAVDNVGNRGPIGKIELNPVKDRPLTVNFDANGGMYAPDSQKGAYQQDVVLTFKRPENAGYAFIGWSTDKTAVVSEYLGGNKLSGNGEITLYAVWKPVSEIVSGDCNADGKVDSGDMALLKNHLAGNDIPLLCNPDSNNDGKVDLSDLSAIKNHLAGN